MESLSLLKESDLKLLNDKAIELGCNLGYLEKDYYLVNVIKCLQEIPLNSGRLIFTGGTALAKGYKLIKRFSEDCDFIYLSQENSRSALSKVKNLIRTCLESYGFIIKEFKSRNCNANIEYRIEYPSISGDRKHLRQELKLEIIHKKILQTNCHKNSIQSFFSECKKQKPEIKDVECVSIEEISIGKLSALIWRTLDKSKEHDPRLIRHLYDLSSISHQLANSLPSFRELCLKIIQSDLQERAKPPLELSLALESILPELLNNPIHNKNYQDYLHNFIYEPLSTNHLSFKDAVNSLNVIIELLQSKAKITKTGQN